MKNQDNIGDTSKDICDNNKLISFFDYIDTNENLQEINSSVDLNLDWNPFTGKTFFH